MSHQNIAIVRNAAPYDFGGGERFPVFLAETLKNQGFSPTIIARSKKLVEFAKENQIPIIKGWWWSKQQWSGVNNLLIPIYAIWQCILFLYYVSLFSKLKVGVVHIQSKDDFIAATHAAKLLNIRVIWTDHADLKHIWRNLSIWYKNPIGKMVYRAALRADVITVVSNSELQLVTNNLPVNSKVRSRLTVVYNGVIDRSQEYPSQPSRLFTYLVASRLVTDKGINEVLAAFKRLSEEFKDIELQIIGDGPEEDNFKKKAANLEHVSLLGHQTQPLSFMGNADVFVHPTYHEGFSVALVEASMMSLPIIATSVGGNVEIIKHNKTGFLVAAQSSNELFMAMKILFENDPLRKTLAENARQQYLEKFQFDVIVKDRFIPLYRGTS